MAETLDPMNDSPYSASSYGWNAHLHGWNALPNCRNAPHFGWTIWATLWLKRLKISLLWLKHSTDLWLKHSSFWLQLSSLRLKRSTYGLNAQFYYWNVHQLCGWSSQRFTVETNCVLLAAVHTKVRQALRTQAFIDPKKWKMKSLALPRPGIEPTLSACIHSAVCRASHHQATTRVCGLRSLFTYWPLHFVWL